MASRAAGVLLHPTSLPGPHGVGDAGPEAARFLAWAQKAGQGIWQVLPLGPTGPGESPYGSPSAFAGNPLLISPEILAADGYFDATASEDQPLPENGTADFASARRRKDRLLRDAWAAFRAGRGPWGEEYEAFIRAPEQASWLRDWATFSALKEKFGGISWVEWPEKLARREPEALAAAQQELAEPIAFHQFVQFLFFDQWGRLKRQAAARGIAILGDLPIYVVHDSADVWVNRHLFVLDETGRPELIAGVPPDYFSKTGQLWGYPLYRWDRMEAEGFSWWVERFRVNRRLADILRVDHFRAFAAYWAVPASERTAVRGEWLPGPGRKLFDRIFAELGRLDIVVEDLGTITSDVEALRDDLRLPGMKVLQFAFSEDDSPHMPHRHVPLSVVYTGTHDNDTTAGWYARASPAEVRRVAEYLGSDETSIVWDLIRSASTSVADRAVVSVQDLLALPGEARMNDPASSSGNWGWRLRAGALTDELAARLRRLSEVSGRARAVGSPSP